jgi:hypothetical protein
MVRTNGRKVARFVLCNSAEGQNRLFRRPTKFIALQTHLTIASSSGQAYVIRSGDFGKSRLNVLVHTFCW